MENPFSKEDITFLTEISEALEPVKIASEKIGREDSNLLQAEASFSFLFKSLEKQDSEISKALLDALKIQIGEKRQIDLVALLAFLTNPEYLSKPNDLLFKMPSKTTLVKTAQRLTCKQTLF